MLVLVKQIRHDAQLPNCNDGRTPFMYGYEMDTLDGDSAASAHQVLSFGPFRLDPVRRVLLEGGKARRLGGRALEILFALVEHAGQIVTKNELIARVWPDSVVQEATLRVHIAALRKVLGDGVSGIRYVENFSGRGYRFVAEVRELYATPAPPITQVSVSSAPESAVVSSRPAGHPVTRSMRLIGRAHIVNVLAERVPQRRFVTLVGPGGVGKTTVALAVADLLICAYPDGIRFVDLTTLNERDPLGSLFATAPDAPTLTQEKLSEALGFLQHKRLLILLDNCEHVIDLAAKWTETLLRIAPGVAVLATSREPLRAQGEHVHRLAPLESPPRSQHMTGDEALEFPAIQLFVERATASLDTFKLRDADAPVVSEICRRLDGNPLAIELAAARMDLFDARALAARLDDRFQLLTRGHRTAQPRHRNLRASLDWSYDLLSSDEKVMLRRLSMFSDGFTLEGAIKLVADEALQAVDVFDILTDLVAKSLLTADFIGEHVVYRLMDTARLYGLEKLRAAGEVAEIRRRHATIWTVPTAMDCVRRPTDSRNTA
jgi:predicted ATPase/DNA-binding winged helix-turn-helix (wHTH) protein